MLRDKQTSLEEGFRICRKILANSHGGLVSLSTLIRTDLKSNIAVCSYTVHRS